MYLKYPPPNLLHFAFDSNSYCTGRTHDIRVICMALLSTELNDSLLKCLKAAYLGNIEMELKKKKDLVK